MSDDLPEGWSDAVLGTLLSEPLANGRSVQDGTGYPVLRLTAIRGGRVDLRERKLGAWSAEEGARFAVRKGDFLIARGNGSLSLVGRGALLEEEPDGVAFPDTAIRARPNEAALRPHYLRLVWDWVGVRTQLEAAAHTSAGIHKVSQSSLAQLRLPLPPLAEQQRIVAKVEALLAEVGASRERLAKVPAILKRFRQSVLAAACSGRLTEEWRESRKNPGSPWRELRLEQCLAEPMVNGRSVPDAATGFPVLRLTALKAGVVDLHERKVGAWSAKDASRHLVTKGDFLVARGNGSLSLVGRGGLVEDEPDPVAFPDTLIRIRPKNEVIASAYLRLVWNAPDLRRQVEAAAHTSAGIHKVSQKDLADLMLPVPPPDEQREVVRRVEALFAVADKIEKHVAAATARAERITQAVLAKAFRGELVPTEAEMARQEGREYEPASVLLEKLAKEPTPSFEGTGRRGRRKVV